MRKGNTRVRPLNFSHCPNKPAPDTQTIPFFEMPAGNSYPAPSRVDRVQMIRDGDWGRVRCEHVTWLMVTCSQESTKDETFILASGAVSILVTNVSVQFPFRLVCSRKCSWFLSCGQVASHAGIFRGAPLKTPAWEASGQATWFLATSVLKAE